MNRPLDPPSATALPLLARADEDGVARLVMQGATNRNALSNAMMAALQAEFDAIRADQSVRVVVLAATGPVFCAGHDLKEMSAARAMPDRGRAAFQAVFETCTRLMSTILRLPQPVIAEVQGIATAAGCQLVATCDLAVAGASARFCTPGVSIGLFCSTPMVALSRNVSRKVAMEMLLTADMVAPEVARDVGLINRVVPDEDLTSEAMALARSIAKRSARTVKIGKEAFYRQVEMSIDDAYRYTSEVMVENMLARDAEEGIGAFMEKREPTWRDG